MSSTVNEELCLAAEKGDLVKARDAIDRGADLNAWPEGTDSALCVAVSYHHPDVVRLLVDAGADVRHAGKGGRRPLHSARDAEIARLLIDGGAELGVVDDGGYDALCESVTRGIDDVAAVLLERGLSVIRYTSPAVSVHAPKSHLQWAVFCKRPKVVRRLLAHGCDPNEYSTWGMPVIFDAFRGDAQEGNECLEIAGILIEAGARVDEELLPMLCSRRAPWLVALALTHGAHVTSGALQAAAGAGDVEMLAILRAHPSANVDATCVGGQTALMAAASAGHAEAVDWLLRFGATPTLRDRNGETALHHAARQGALDVLLRLEKAGCRIDEETHQGWTALHHAAQCRSNTDLIGVVELLLARGIAVDHRARDGTTPLMVAAAAGSVLVRELLLSRGADPSLADALGSTEADDAHQRLAEEDTERERQERWF